MIGKLIGSAIRLVNAPLKAIDEISTIDPRHPNDLLSGPLETLAESFEEADKDGDER